MARIVVSAAARTDFRSIVDDLEKRAGRRVALRYAMEFDAAFDRVANFPGIGSPRPTLGLGTRMAIVDPYLIFYEINSADDVLVLRILHGHRNITSELIRRP